MALREKGDIRPKYGIGMLIWSKSRFGDKEREEKARVWCGDQKSGVILPFFLKILQEGRRKKLG